VTLPLSDRKYLQGFEDGAKHERARIVGLFDAQDVKDDWCNVPVSVRRIIEGLREKK
jgi:hypothetical protein